MTWNLRPLHALFALCLCWTGFGPTQASAESQPTARVLDAERQRIDVMRSVAPSVVAVFGADNAGGGSGVLISPDGFALTNFHVIHGSGPFLRCGLNDENLYDAVISGIDPTGDVAVIKLLGRTDFPAAKFGDSDRLKVGEWVFAMGNPFLLATDFHPTVTYGIVSGLHRYQYPSQTILEYTDCIQIDASINPGNSGGPLFNMRGELVGINGRASFEKRGRVNVGAAYAISINQILKFLDALRAGRIVDHSTLGATVSTDGQGRVIVSGIQETADAYRMGLRLDDEILTFAGRTIRSVNQFKNILGIYPQDAQVSIAWRRDGKRTETRVRLQPLHEQSELIKFVEGEPPPSQRPGSEPPQKPNPTPPPESEPSPTTKKSDPGRWQQLYVARKGFGNYFFNLEQRKRCLAKLRDWNSTGQWPPLWILEGTTTQKQPYELKIGMTGAGLILGKQQEFEAFRDDEPPHDEPVGSGGFLAALRHVQLLLTAGPERFTECCYWGSEAYEGERLPVDVIRCDLGGSSSYWYFRREDQTWLGLRYHLTGTSPPCEIRCGPTKLMQGKAIPTTIGFTGPSGLNVTLQVESVTFETSTPLPPPPKSKSTKEEPSD